MQDRGYEQAAHLYDLFDDKDNIDFFRHYAATAGEILDIGAGTGRIAIPLAEQGARLVCVEPSPAMRAQFQAKLTQRPALRHRITLVAADAATFNLGRTFSAAFLFGSFDHLLSDDERLASLRNIAHHLQPGGTLVFDVFLGLMRESPLVPTGQVQVGDREYRRLVGVRVLPEGITEVTLVFESYQDGEPHERIEQLSWAGITNRPGVHRLLREAGFTVQREYSDFRFHPFREGDALLLIEAILRR